MTCFCSLPLFSRLVGRIRLQFNLLVLTPKTEAQHCVDAWRQSFKRESELIPNKARRLGYQHGSRGFDYSGYYGSYGWGVYWRHHIQS